MAQPALAAENLHLWRGEHHVLRGVSLALRGGECLEVTGSNGAGKTSLLRTLCALSLPEQGRVTWEGRDVRVDLAAFHRSLLYLGHEPPLKADLTARENLHGWLGVRRPLAPAELDAALRRVGGGGWGDRLVRTLSAGQRRRAALAALDLAQVPLWVLDEPTTNLDRDGQALVSVLIAEQLARGGMVVAAVHHGLPDDAHAVARLELAS